MGYCGPVVDLDKFKEGFQRTISRGPDDSRIVDTGNGLLGFHRLAIMGLTPSGMQPFQLDGSYVVCNGEIYGFEKIKEELSEFPQPEMLLIASAVDKKTDIHFFKYFPFNRCL